MVTNKLEKEIENYLREYRTLKKIEKIQKNLKLPVKLEERKKRIQKVLSTRNKGKKILEKIENKIKIPKAILRKIKKIVEKADHIKRENCLLQVSGAVGVLKPNELCIFKEKSRNNLMEIRKYFALHKTLYYDDGLSVSMAVTSPKLIQNYHSHLKMCEYTTILSGTIYVKAKTSKRIKVIKAKKSDTVIIRPYTIHTLINRTNKIGLNITVKIPVGFSDRKHFDEIPEKAIGDIKLLKARTIKREWGKEKSFKSKSNGYTYKADFLSIKPLGTMVSQMKNDSCIYVINGNVKIEYAEKEKIARKDNLIFVARNTKHKIKNLSREKTIDLYRVEEL